MQAKRVLLPVNGDDSDEESLTLACNLVRESKGKIYVLYVIEVARQLPLDSDVSSEFAKGEEVLQRIESLGKKYHVEVEAEILQAREAGPAVVQEAVERQVGAIVVGTMTGWWRTGKKQRHTTHLQFGPVPFCHPGKV